MIRHKRHKYLDDKFQSKFVKAPFYCGKISTKIFASGSKLRRIKLATVNGVKFIQSLTTKSPSRNDLVQTLDKG